LIRLHAEMHSITRRASAVPQARLTRVALLVGRRMLARTSTRRWRRMPGKMPPFGGTY
jgi:hypothetical protein